MPILDLEEEMKRPEKIYDLLYSLLPKCPKCGRLGMYKKPGAKQQKQQPGQQPGQKQAGQSQVSTW